MRLQKIIVNGFKSFADKTEFAFDSSVTAVVGPNGCGKSNIVDAVKWALGEQSSKSLRSDQMADVIFGGSGSRRPMGSAEVSLLLSNNGDGARLPIEADEVQISRRIFKSGESEYRINNKVCRLKDIRELFFDTGVGTKAYSIIEQGQIERLVSASKTDRRVVFEEAAGVSKYKAHKKEALRKLERTEQNLLRLADVLGEVQRQLRSVKLQAGKARSYLQYTERLKELQVNYSLAEYANYDSQWSEKQDDLGELQQQLEQTTTEIAKNDALVSQLGEQKINTEHELSATGNTLVSIQSKIEQQLQRIEFLQARTKELQERRDTATRRIDELKEQSARLERSLAQYKRQHADCEDNLKAKTEAVEKLQSEIQDLDGQCASLQAELEDDKSGIIDIVRRTAQLHNEIQSISVYRNNLTGQKDRLTNRAELARTELEKLLTEKAQHKARRDDVEKVLGELHDSLDAKRKKIEQVDEILATDKERLAHSRETRSTLNGELAILEDMEKRREGLNSGVQKLLGNTSDTAERPDYVEGVLAEILSTEYKYANAVEAALEGKTDALVVSDRGRLFADADTLENLEGRVHFICLDCVEPFVDASDFSDLPWAKGRLAEFVNCDPKYAPLAWHLLGKTIVVDQIDAAEQLPESVTGGYQFVTLDGKCLSPDGTIRLGPLGKTAGLISRKSRMRQLTGTIESITSEIDALQEQIESNNHSKAHLEKLCKDLRTAVYEANTQKMQIDSKLDMIEQNVQQLKKEEPLIAGEMDMLEEQIAESVQKEYESKQQLEEIEVVNEQRSARIEELETKYAERKAEQQAQTERLTELKVALGQATEQSKALEQMILNAQNQVDGSSAAARTAETEIENSASEMQRAARDILNCEAAVSELFAEKEDKQRSNHALCEELEQLGRRQNEIEQKLRQHLAEKAELEEKANALKIELSQVDVKRQTLAERVREELQIDLAEAYKTYTDNDVNWESVREEINDLRAKIERLGNVNVDAIAEQETLEERNSFLSSQVEDLNESKAQLQQLIARLNKKSREKFEQTFEEIRVHFQQIFRKLFGGGKADIVLEDAEDILEAGIEVIARPPGKETRSISLLSGGEKSMTAIALLFAIFKAKPSPFCFLDEIDAALDEANNERFNLLLREFQKDSQFIIITHAKRTMSIADELVGITMQTQGVSKKISVRFDQFGVEEEAAAVA
jgi:chromosome segregation protein